MGRILVGYDESEHARRALRWAAREATVRSSALTVVHAYPVHAWTGPFDTPPAQQPLHSEAVRILDDGLATLHDVVGELETDGEVVGVGDRGVAHALIERSRDVELVVVGSRGRGGFAGMLLGSVSQQVAAHAHAPVAVIPGGERGAVLDPAADGTRDIVVGVDGSDASIRALRVACTEARLRGVAVEAVSVHPEVPTIYYDPAVGFDRTMRERVEADARAAAERRVRDAVGQVAACGGVTLTETVTSGPVAQSLVAIAGDRVVIVASRGRGGFASLVLGSVSRQVLHHARGPIVVVPASARAETVGPDRAARIR